MAAVSWVSPANPVYGRCGGQWRLDPQTPWVPTQMMHHWHQGLIVASHSAQQHCQGLLLSLLLYNFEILLIVLNIKTTDNKKKKKKIPCFPD